MPAIPVNPGPFSWKAPGNDMSGAFRPIGTWKLIGARTNPPIGFETDDDVYAVRLFVGFNVGGTPRWALDDLVAVVKRVRAEQKRKPDASFIAQRGIYTSDANGEIVTEDGAQIIIINAPDPIPLSVFRDEMIMLAETIAREFEQELVLIDLQKNGSSIKTIGVTP